jgi:hypothetical protein
VGRAPPQRDASLASALHQPDAGGDMGDGRQIGEHFIRFVPPDLIYVEFRGDVSTEQARELSLFFAQPECAAVRRYLVDVRRLGSMASGARRELAMPRRTEPPDDTDCRIQLAFVGASMRARVLLTVTIAAAQALKDIKLSSVYFDTMPEALAWAGIDPAALRPPSPS